MKANNLFSEGFCGVNETAEAKLFKTEFYAENYLSVGKMMLKF
jgi:hypothetical protein